MSAPDPMEPRTPSGFDRQPPFSPEAEVSVLGGMLIDRDAVARAVEVVKDSMFFREAHRRLYRAMTRLFNRGDVIDVYVQPGVRHCSLRRRPIKFVLNAFSP